MMLRTMHRAARLYGSRVQVAGLNLRRFECLGFFSALHPLFIIDFGVLFHCGTGIQAFLALYGNGITLIAFFLRPCIRLRLTIRFKSQNFFR